MSLTNALMRQQFQLILMEEESRLQQLRQQLLQVHETEHQAREAQQQQQLKHWRLMRREWNQWLSSTVGLLGLVLLFLFVGMGLGVNYPSGVSCRDELCSFLRIRPVEIRL